MGLLLFALCVAILLCRRWLARSVVALVTLFGGSPSAAVWIYSVLTLPGILVHEISHFLVAALTGLRTGNIELLPSLLADGGVELGSVQVERKDPLRLALVGLAPLLFGIPLLLWLSALVSPLNNTTPVTFMSFIRLWLTFPHSLLLYLLSTIALHMFPSRRDMNTWPIAVLLLCCISWGFWMLGIRLPQTSRFLSQFLSLQFPLETGLTLALGAILISLFVIRFVIIIITMGRCCTIKPR